MEWISWEMIRPVLAAGAMAIAVFLVAANLPLWRRSASRLSRFAGLEASAEDVEVGSEDYRTRLAFSAYGLEVTGKEQIALWTARLGAGAAGLLAFLILGAPPLMAIAAFPLGLFLVHLLVKGAWTKLCRDIEKEVPIFLSRLSSIIQLESSVLSALDAIAETMEERSALRRWLLRLIARCQAGGAEGLEAMTAEAYAISPSLGLAVFEVGRYWETGGPGYIEAFRDAADSVGVILQARGAAAAKGAAAKGAVGAILLSLLVAMIVILRSPQLRVGIDTPMMQLAYAGLLGWMGLGWVITNDLIDGAV